MKRRNGFTLLELSIVMVIIGLIIAGILSATSMIRNAQIRSMLSEEDSHIKAIKQFQDKYLALPGDMPNASGYWPGAGNGAGIGTIGSSSLTASLSNTGDWFLAWQHLADAGFIHGIYTGVNGSGGANEATIGVNVPGSRLPSAGWTVNYYLYPNNGTNSFSGALWPDQYGHLLNLGGFVATDYTKGAVLTAAEASIIDQKIDDGYPGSGNVRAWRTSVLPNCIGGTVADGAGTQYTATYNTLYSTNACSLVFLLGF